MTPNRNPEHGRDETTTPEGGVRPHQESKEYEARRQEREGRRQETQRNEVLKFIIESGRAETPEEAEAHLETVNRLKERLLGFLQELARDFRVNEERYESPQVYYKDSEEVQAVPKDVITLLQPEDLDRTEPYLWYLDRVVSADWKRQLREALQLIRKEGDAILLIPDHMGVVGRRMAAYFTKEEIAFLRREHEFASQDLARNLRKAADDVVRFRDMYTEWADSPLPQKNVTRSGHKPGGVA